jgi:FHA domain-containing protein
MAQSVVISLCNAPLGQPVAATFGVEGGTIGRASANTLVLDDPERTVSRVHAQVVYRDGRYFIIDRGSNPPLYNGQALGAGHEVPLNDGDRLTISSFELAIAVLADAAPASASTVAGAVPPAGCGRAGRGR